MLVHAKGGDGKRPLHYASNVQIAEYLLAQGAEIDAICDDHESTAAQYLVADQPEVCRYLISYGCKTDLFMACALNDVELAREHIKNNPDDIINIRVDDEYFPKVNPQSAGTMYQWILGFLVSPTQVARKFRSQDVLDLLLKHASPAQQLLDALWGGELVKADALISKH